MVVGICVEVPRLGDLGGGVETDNEGRQGLLVSLGHANRDLNLMDASLQDPVAALRVL